MIEKPIAKEVVLRQFSGPIYKITATTKDAQQSVESVCPEFGRLLRNDNGVYMFVVSDAYDIDEVIAYLKEAL